MFFTIAGVAFLARRCLPLLASLIMLGGFSLACRPRARQRFFFKRAFRSPACPVAGGVAGGVSESLVLFLIIFCDDVF